jgi:hypothetical protein
MPNSSVTAFIASLPHPPNGLSIDLLRDLAKAAKQLAVEQPDLAAPLTLIRLGFATLANLWDGEVLSPRVAQSITPRLVAAATMALEAPGFDSANELAKAIAWALDYPLLSGIGEGAE